jgi:hypothetical protein
LKIVHIETLIKTGTFPDSETWKQLRDKIHECIKKVDWPHGSGKFTIHPESGKKRGEGNGVVPIKTVLINELKTNGWKTEHTISIKNTKPLGGLDAIYQTSDGIVALEWETGNISSSHRAINKMSLFLLHSAIVAGILVVPSASLAKYLTDRIGNYPELEPYLSLWKSIPCKNGILEIVVIEQDNESEDVKKIPKGKDGRAIE